ncbi:MAG TPA: hypothetical protein PKD78_13790, partial [Saprospiraceae bacterium]|nr:hypothetical protein [Saprospiraceae bacterium]
ATEHQKDWLAWRLRSVTAAKLATPCKIMIRQEKIFSTRISLHFAQGRPSQEWSSAIGEENTAIRREHPMQSPIHALIQN